MSLGGDVARSDVDLTSRAGEPDADAPRPETILAGRPRSILVLDRSGVIACVNTERVAAAGYRPEELLGRPFIELVHPDDRAVCATAFATSIRTNHEVPITLRCRQPNGAWIVLRVVCTNCLAAPDIRGIVIEKTEGLALAPGQGGGVAEPARQGGAEHGDSAARLRILLGHTLDFIEILDPAGIVQYINPAVAAAAGYLPEELVGHHFLEFVHPEDQAKAIAAFAQVLLSTGPEHVTLRYRHKDGSWRTAEHVGRNLLDEPEVRGIMIHARDVTDHVRAEDALHESEQRYRSLINAMAEGVLLQDENGAILTCNESAEKILGLSADQMMGSTSMDLRWRTVHEDGAPFAGEMHPAMVTLRTGEPQADVTMGVYRPDGQLTWISVNTQPVYAKGSAKPSAVVSSFHDITRRKHAEEVLRASAEEIEDLYNNAPCGYHSLDAGGRIVRINETELKWLGYSRDEVIGMRLVQLLAPKSQQTFEDTFPVFMERGWARDLELDLVRKDGTLLPVLLSATTIRDRDGKFVKSRSTVYDITERRRSEDALRTVNRSLRVLSDCNTALVRADTQTGLLTEICRLLVETGGYLMAWVGFAENDAEKSVSVAAQYGDDTAYLSVAKVSWADNERGRGPIGTAMRTGVAQVNQSFATNPRIAPWRDDAIARGFASSIALQLASESSTFGVLSIMSGEPEAFDPEEVRLLQELADDLSYGIGALRTRAEHRRAEEQAQRLAYYDPLTGLPNRVRLHERLEQAIAAARARQNRLALLTLNVDRFRELQSGLGIRQADGLLQQIAQRLQAAVRDDGFLARLGADEFAVLLPAGGADSAMSMSRTVREATSHPYERAGISLDVSMSMGSALFPDHGADADALLLRSNIAAQQARREGTGYTIYSGATDQESPRRLALVAELRRAIEAEQLLLYYQPKIDIRSGKISGVEALVRWQHPERGMIPPHEFIGMAEHTGLIKPLTSWVIRAATYQCARWHRLGMDMPVAVNVSPTNLREPEFLDKVTGMLQTWGLDPELMQIEITETTLMTDRVRSHDLLMRLKQIGVRTCVDDFGTGYSSLSYIATLPIHALKIDRSFIVNMMERAEHRSVVEAAISLAHSLGLKVIAEGVETVEQARALQRLDCDELQGFLFSRPVPADRLKAWSMEFSLERFGLSDAR